MEHLTLRRREAELIRRAKGWLLVYGRRKVGKTFLLRREIAWDLYATVTRSRDVLLESGGVLERVGLEESVRRVMETLRNGGCAVVDEFQRLPEAYWDLLALAHPSGKLVLSGSSFGVVERVFSRRSPLLGLVNPISISIVSYADAVASLAARLSAEKALLWAVVLRDPWVIPFADLSRDPAEFVAESAGKLAIACSGLVGEVFAEEERKLTTLYEAVLRLLAEDCWRPSEIAGALEPRGLLEGGAAAAVGVLEKMAKMGLVRKLKAWKSRGARVYYRHYSPLLSLVYYLDQKFSVSECYPVNSESVRSAMGREVEYCVAELMAERDAGIPGFHVSPEGGVDVVVFKGGRPVAGYEVKVGVIERAEARRAIERMRSLGLPRAGLVSLRERPPEAGGAEALGPEDLVAVAKRLSRKETP